MKCAICDKDFVSLKALSAHISQKHDEYARDRNRLYYDSFIDTSEHKCPYCGADRKFLNLVKGYNTTCGSRECGKLQERKTRFEKYGKYESEDSIARGLTKQKETMLHKYGVEHNFKWSVSRKRAEGTKLAKYGDSNFNNPEKMKDTRIANNDGVYWSPGQLAKSQRTKLVTYGDANYHNAELMVRTRRGLGKYTLNPYSQARIDSWNDRHAETCKARRLSAHVFRCELCDTEFVEDGNDYIQRSIANRTPLCIHCFPKSVRYNSSHYEQELIEEIRKFHDGQIVEHDRTILNGKELDIYLPEHALAIEFDGLYWHRNDRNRHLEKTEMCEARGIHLIHVFEDEWVNSKEIVLDRIRSSTGSNERVFARKCDIVNVDNETYRAYCERYHIQGYVGAKYKFGLLSGDRIVAVASFGKNRFADNEYELLRYCSPFGISVIGGMARLVEHFKRLTNCARIVSYADRRYTSSLKSVYGNNIVNVSKPGYKYFRGTETFNRLMFQKHKLKTNELTRAHYDDSLTEYEICLRAGLNRIYDCGQLKFEL